MLRIVFGKENEISSLVNEWLVGSKGEEEEEKKGKKESEELNREANTEKLSV